MFAGLSCAFKRSGDASANLEPVQNLRRFKAPLTDFDLTRTATHYAGFAVFSRKTVPGGFG